MQVPQSNLLQVNSLDTFSATQTYSIAVRDGPLSQQENELLKQQTVFKEEEDLSAFKMRSETRVDIIVEEDESFARKDFIQRKET